jgi:hypothetical protein
MDTTDQILLIVVTVLLSIFIIICIAVTVGLLKLVTALRQLVEKAEGVVDSVESAAEVFKDTQGKLAAFKVIRNIIKMVSKD